MHWESLAKLLMEENDSMIYIIEKETYRFKYMNMALKRILGLDADDETYLEKKCYELLHGRTTPCEACKHSILNDKSYFKWEQDNDYLGEHLFSKDKLIHFEGKEYHLQVSEIDTPRIKRRREKERQLEIAKALMACIRTLEADIEVRIAINKLLEVIAHYYKSDRTYLFEINYDANTLSNTYEWAADGVTKEIDNLQNIPLEVISTWVNMFETKGAFYISNLDDDVKKSSDEYKILKAQNINSLMAVPLVKKGIITGFLGVDNPRNNYDDFTLLTSVTYVIENDIEKRKTMARLEKLSYEDSLTGLYNRNRYNYDIKRLKENKPATLGVIFMDLNGLKKINDTKGHESGDELIKNTAAVIKKVFDNAYRIGGDEFVVFLENITADDMERYLQQIRSSMEDAAISVAIGHDFKVGAVDVEAQIKLADKVMYGEKYRV